MLMNLLFSIQFRHNENSNIDYFYSNKPVESYKPSIMNNIAKRINRYGMWIYISHENNSIGIETSYKAYQSYGNVEESE